MREAAAGPLITISSLNARDGIVDRHVRLWLLSATELKGKTYYRIAGRCMHDGHTWEVYRRYSEFLQLREKLIKYFSYAPSPCPGCLNYLHAIKQFDFPKKHIFVSKTQLVVNYRIRALRSFVDLLASWTLANTPKCPTCGGFAFDVVRNFVLDGAEPIDGAEMNAIRDLMVVSTFTANGEQPPSATFLRTSERRPSWIPASGSMKLQDHQQHGPSLQKVLETTNPAMTMDDAYENFNDYLPGKPKQSVRMGELRPNQLAPNQEEERDVRDPRHNESFVSFTSEVAEQQRGSVSSQRRAGSLHGSFLMYNDAASDARSDVSFGTISTDAYQKKGILKNKADPAPTRPMGSSFMAGSTHTNQYSTEEYGAPSNYDYGRRSAPGYSSSKPLNHGSVVQQPVQEQPQHQPQQFYVHPPTQQPQQPQQQPRRQSTSFQYDTTPNPSIHSSVVGYSDQRRSTTSTRPSAQTEYSQGPQANMLSSPNTSLVLTQPNLEKQQRQESANEDTAQSLYDSFISEDLISNSAEPILIESDDEVRMFKEEDENDVEGDDDEDDEEIDVTGVSMTAPPSPLRRKSTSGEGLWQPWELAKAG